MVTFVLPNAEAIRLDDVELLELRSGLDQYGGVEANALRAVVDLLREKSITSASVADTDTRVLWRCLQEIQLARPADRPLQEDRGLADLRERIYAYLDDEGFFKSLDESA